jgi:hypothetical protein
MARVDLTAYQLENLVEAACQYATVMELLSVIHSMRNREELESSESDILNVASVAALLARAQRLNQGIDL